MNSLVSQNYYQKQLPINWWQGTGFLYGDRGTLDVDDPTRISTNVFDIPPYGTYWQPLATGVFNVPASVDGEPYTAPRADPVTPQTPYWKTTSPTPLGDVDVPDSCKLNCTMGGCSDPTSSVHSTCVAAGCCSYFSPPSSASDPPTMTKNISEMAYGDQDCTVGPNGAEGYCRSQYTYNQCKPGSLWDAWEDPDCFKATGGNAVPYYVIF